MKQLDNQDAGFIYNETPTTPMHTAGLGIYDQSTVANQPLGHKDIIKYIADRIHLTPIFRYKYVEVPFGLDKPYFTEDPNFNLEFHIRHIALPQPGDWRQLCIMVSRLNSKPLDFNHPLWEAYIIEGLDNIDGLPKGSFAILVKLHHSIVNGASGQEIFGALHDLLPDSIPSKNQPAADHAKSPSSLGLLGKAVPQFAQRPLQYASAIYRHTPRLIRNMTRMYQGELESGTRLKVPQTRFNYNVSPYRVFEGSSFSLDDIKYIRNAVGKQITNNDVMLNIVAGGLRLYLSKHQELPEESLCIMLPQDTRSDSSEGDFDNKVGGLFADIHTDIANPIERLNAISESTKKAKQFAIEMDITGLIQNYMGGFLTPLAGRRLNRFMQKTRILERFGPFACNSLLTSVPGPSFPLYHAGAKMVAYWGIPPITDSIGLSHATFSYCGRVTLSVTACRQMMPDPADYMDCMVRAFEELLEAAKRHNKEHNSATNALPTQTKRKRSAKSSSSSSSTNNT